MLNIGQRCATVSATFPGQKAYAQVTDTRDAIYGSEGWECGVPRGGGGTGAVPERARTETGQGVVSLERLQVCPGQRTLTMPHGVPDGCVPGTWVPVIMVLAAA
jgi:hypothetical protein